MKKRIAFPLFFAFLLSLAACGGFAPGTSEKLTVRTDIPDIRLTAEETPGRVVAASSGLPEILIPMRDWTEGTALLAETGDAAFYGQADGSALLRWGEAMAEFDWLYATPRAIAPKLWLADADGDGAEELLVCCFGGSGTGVSRDFLYVVEKGAEGLVSREFPWDALADMLDEQLNLVTVGDTAYAALGRELVDITVLLTDMETQKVSLCLGQISGYTRTEDGLQGTFAVLVTADNVPYTGLYAAEVQAAIRCEKDGSFVVTDLHLLSTKE